MRDFSEVVRRNLGRLPLPRARAEEIVMELANQMEDAYKEAIARGLPEARAEAEAMTQLGDWEKLRRSIVTSERGERVMWPHPWAVPRAAGWMALVLVGVLCLIPNFRRALRQAPSVVSPEWGGVSENELRDLAARGVRDHDARLVAFAAIHMHNGPEASQMAEQAIAMDPSLTWIGSRFASTIRSGISQDVWIQRLMAWDPDNAVPQLFIAEPLFLSAVPAGSALSVYSPTVTGLAATTPWGQQMQAAFDKPRYDTYDQRRYELERSVVRAIHGEDSELLVWYSAQVTAIPQLSQAMQYAALITRTLGPEAERAGHFDEAAKMYWSVARFGQLLEANASWDWEQMSAWKLQESAYASLVALDMRAGKKQETTALRALQHRVESAAGEGESRKMDARRRSWESNGHAAAIAWLAAWLMMVSAGAFACWAALVAFRRPERMLSGWAGALALASSYAPGLLLGAGAVMYSAMSPFLRSPYDFATRQGLFEAMCPFWLSFWMGWGSMGEWRIYLREMFLPVVLSFIVLIIGIAVLRWVARTRSARAPAVE